MSINLWFDYYNIMSSEYWTNIINGVGTDVSYSVSADPSRNILTAGSVGAGYSNVHYTTSDIFAAIPPYSGYLVKFDPYGLPLWRSFVSNTSAPATNIVTANCVTASSSSNVYIGGGSIGFAETYDSSGVGVSGDANRFIPRNSGYIVKYNTDGAFIWRVFFANTLSSVTVSGTTVNSLALDSSENVYAFGSIGSASTTNVNSNIYQSTDTFPNAGTSVGFRQTIANNPLAFVTKFDIDGVFQWRAFIDTPGTIGIDSATFGAVDSNGDVYVTGYTGAIAASIYTSAVTPTTVTPTIPANSAFLVKYDTDGFVKWRSYIDDFNTLTGTSDFSYGVTTDTVNNVYIVGKTGTQTGVSNIYNSNIYGTTLAGVTIPITSAATTAYIVKYGPTGNFLWRAYIDGAGADVSNSINTDTDNNVIVCGVTGTTVATIYNSSGVASHTIPPSSSFVVKYNQNGYVLNRYYVSSGSTGIVTGYAVTTDIYKNIISVGNIGTVNGFVYNSNVDSNCFTGYTIPAGSSFITKHNSDGVIPLSTGTYPTLVSNGWAVNWSNSTSCISFGCFVSPDGLSVYKVGGISGTTVSVLSNSDRSFSGYTIPSSTGCIVKYDQSGNFQWRSYILGTASNVTCVHGNNSYVYAGGTSGTASATLHDIYGNINTTLQANAGFITQYDSSGGIIQKAYISNSTINSIFYTPIDGDESVYLGGLTHPRFTSNIVDSSGNSVGELEPNTGFVWKLNSGLSHSWVVKFKPTSGTSICPVMSVSAPSNDYSIYAGGYSNSIVQVNYTQSDATSGTLLPAARANAAFVCKLTNLGAFSWKSSVDSLTLASQEFGTGVTTDATNVFFTGHTGTGTSNVYDTNDVVYGGFRPINATSGFLIKYDTSGNLLWYSNISTGTVTSNCVAIDSNGDVYIGGKGGASSVIAHSNIYGSLSTGITTPTDSAFISKYDGRTGRSIWRSYIDAAASVDVIRSISIDSSNYIYTSGYIGAAQATVYNSNSSASTLTVPLNSSFIVKYKPNGAIIF